MTSKSLVLGSSSGLGQQILLNLRSRGEASLSHSRSFEPGAAVVGDASTQEFRTSLFDLLSTDPIDKVFLTVGAYSDAVSPNLDFSELDNAYRNNLLAGISIIDTVVSAWSGKGRGGKLVVINSIAALSPNPKEPVYGAMKAALSYFTNSVRLGVLAQGIQVIEVFPGAMKTRMTQNRDGWETLMTPEAVAETIVNLSTQDAFLVSSIEIRNNPR